MPETSLYVPVLKSKNGEYLALRHLGYSCLRSVTPLIDISPPATPRKKGSKQTTLSAQMRHHAKQISECWRFSELPILIDTQLVPNGGEALRLLSRMLKNHHVVPTHGPGRSDAYVDVVAEVVKTNPLRGVCYRIPRSSLYDSDLDTDLERFINRCALSPSEIDLIVDLESVSVEPTNESQMAVIGRVNSFPHLNEFRSFTITAGSFPLDLTGVGAGLSERKRVEWKLWQNLIAGKKLLRQPRYGDYGIQNPALSDVGFLGKANIRYTSKESWIVFRGATRIDQRSATHNLSAEMKTLCELAVTCEDICDSDYSWADEYIHACAGVEAPANDASKWKAVGFNHHITYVVNQLRAYP